LTTILLVVFSVNYHYYESLKENQIKLCSSVVFRGIGSKNRHKMNVRCQSFAPGHNLVDLPRDLAGCMPLERAPAVRIDARAAVFQLAKLQFCSFPWAF
jgi:hypothetical protein